MTQFDMDSIEEQVLQLFEEQMGHWPLAAKNYAGLLQTQIKSLRFNESIQMRIQYNAARMKSSAAKVDDVSISERPCFLCSNALPAEQKGVSFGEDYQILINPYPIFPKHLTIPHTDHTPQLIQGRIVDMMLLAKALPHFTIFYNGPNCGASAPDHFHFQAGNKGFLPIEEIEDSDELLFSRGGTSIFSMPQYLPKTLVIHGVDIQKIEDLFESVCNFLSNAQPDEVEPMLNIICAFEDGSWRMWIFPRSKHRPHYFFMEGASQIILSPASVDFGGVLITPREEDFHKLDKKIIENIFQEVALQEEIWSQLIAFIKEL